MTFQPHGGTHAVEVASFQLLLREPLPPSSVISSSFPRETPWSAQLLGRREVAPAIDLSQLQFGKEPVVAQGTEFVLFQPDGSPAWLLRIARDQLSVECHVYTRWQQVWDEAASYLSQAAAYLSELGVNIEIARAVMQVTDRFVSEGESCDVIPLLRTSSTSASVVLTQPHAWHSHVGWYEQVDNDWLLQNINLDLVPLPQVDPFEIAQAWQLKVLHFQRRHFAKSLEMGPVAKANRVLLEPIFDQMHRRNKVEVKALLTEEASKQIGLVA